MKIIGYPPKVGHNLFSQHSAIFKHQRCVIISLADKARLLFIEFLSANGAQAT